MQKLNRLLLIPALFILLTVGYLHPITAMTQDLGRHFLLGKIILETHRVPLTNLFSYTYPDFPFINLHWLSEVLFYLVFTITGFNGLLLLATIIILLAFAIVFIYSLRKGNIFAVSIIALLSIHILLERTDIRPEIFSFLFLAIYATVLYQYRLKFTKWVFILIPLSLLWVNLHIYFIVGIGIIGLFLIDSILQERLLLYEYTRRRKNLPKKTVILLTVFLLSLFATLCNPNFISGATYPLLVFQNYGYAIEENQTIFFLESLGFQKPAIFYFKISVLLFFTTLILNWKMTRPIDWLLGIAFAVIGAQAVRNMPLFVFATFIPASYHFSHLLRTFSEKFIKPQQLLLLRNLAAILLLLLIAWHIRDTVLRKPLGLGVAKGAERAADFFIAAHLDGPIFNNFDIGSYLTYRLYPKERVFVDGRPGEYPESFFQKTYIPMQQDMQTFAQVDKRYSFNTIFFSHTDQTPWATTFLADIIRSPGWKTVYLDETVIILAKNSKENAALIKKFGMDPEKIHPSSYDSNDFNALVHLANFFNKTQLTAQELAVYQQILTLKPNYCPALYKSAVILSARKDPGATIFSAKYQQLCK